MTEVKFFLLQYLEFQRRQGGVDIPRNVKKVCSTPFGSELSSYLGAAHLQATLLQAAHLQATQLQAAHLQSTQLQAAHLQATLLQAAHLQATQLKAAQL
jgi:hypothetical protein